MGTRVVELVGPVMEEWDAVSLNTLDRLRQWVEKEAAGYPRPFMLGIGGPGGSGKSRVAQWLEKSVLLYRKSNQQLHSGF